jgi:hypothetical protein
MSATEGTVSHPPLRCMSINGDACAKRISATQDGHHCQTEFK